MKLGNNTLIQWNFQNKTSGCWNLYVIISLQTTVAPTNNVSLTKNKKLGPFQRLLSIDQYGHDLQ